MKHMILSEIASCGAFVENPKNVLIGQYNDFQVVIVKEKSNVYRVDFYVDRGNCNMNVLMDFLYREIGVDRSVRCCFYENSTIKVTLKTSQNPQEQLKLLLDKVTSKLKIYNLRSGCGFCGNASSHKAYRIKGQIKILCDGCYENYYETVFGKKLRKNKKDRNIIKISDDKVLKSEFQKKNNIIALPANNNRLELEDKSININKDISNNIKPFRLPDKISENKAEVSRPLELPMQSIKQLPESRSLPATVASLKSDISSSKDIKKSKPKKEEINEKIQGALALKTKKNELQISSMTTTVALTSSAEDGKLEGNPEKGKSVVSGILGATCGAMGGLFIWILAYELHKTVGFDAVSEYAAIAMPALMLIGYSKFTDKITFKGLIAVNVAMIFMMFIALNFTVAINISEIEYSAGGNVGIFGAFKLIPNILMENDANRIAYIKTVVGTYILAAVTDIFVIHIIKSKYKIHVE